MNSRILRWMRADGWRMVAVLALFLVLGPQGHPMASLHARAAADGARPQPTQDWTQVDRLISEQKFAEAVAAAEKLRQAAQKAGDQDGWARALIKEIQLRTALHGYETAVRFLKEQAWPEGLFNRAALNLFYARSLVNYYSAYSWEINQREKTDSRVPVDLKAWTKDQIYAEAQKAYEEVWKQRGALGAEPLARFSDFLERNNYPEGIRPTLRDAVSYLYEQLLSNDSLWTPQQSNETFRLDLKALLSASQAEVSLSDPSVHPLVKACFLMSDLERWHTQNRRREAALEARLQRLESLHSAFSEESRPSGWYSGERADGCNERNWALSEACISSTVA